MPIKDKREYKISPLQTNENFNLNEQLIVFENEINLDFVELKKYKRIYYVLLSNNARSIQLDQKVLEYKRKIIENNDKMNCLKKFIHKKTSLMPYLM